MFVGGNTQQRERQSTGRGASVRSIELRHRVHDESELTDRSERASERAAGSERWLLPALAALLLTVPVLMYAGVEAGLSHRALLLVAAAWSLGEVPLLAHLVDRRLRTWSHEDDAQAELCSLGARAASAEASVRRDQDRLHELRATVAGIRTTYGLLHERQDRMPAPARSRLERLYETELARLERLLVDDPLVSPEPVDVNTAIDPLVDGLRLRGHRVAWGGARALATGRHDDVVEIVHVLLENALRHAPGSPVSLRVRRSSAQVLVSVSDEGPGIDPDVASRLFERGARAPESPGQGIGLNIARRLAVEMGGQLSLDPRSSSRGASFTLALPAAEESASCLARSG